MPKKNVLTPEITEDLQKRGFSKAQIESDILSDLVGMHYHYFLNQVFRVYQEYIDNGCIVIHDAQGNIVATYKTPEEYFFYHKER